MSDDNDPMVEIKASFFLECDDLLEALQDGLEQMDSGEADGETINVIFRAVHSIKGGAGAFGMQDLVAFAHRYETALDEVRSDRLEAGPEAIKLFFAAADHLADLVRHSRDETAFDTDRRDALLAQLDNLLAYLGSEEEETIDFQPTGLALDLGAGDAEDARTRFTVTFTPHAELFENGHEPLILLRSLAALGDAEIQCATDELPPLDSLAPEGAYLSWTVQLETEAEEAELHEIFEFVEGLCDLAIERALPDLPGLPDLPDLADLPGLPDLPALPDPAATRDAAEVPPPAAKADAPGPAAATPPPAAGTGAPKPASQKARASSGGDGAASVVRVDLERIERLVNLVGELVINQSMLSQSLAEAGLSQHSDAMNGIEEYQRLTRDIQDSVMLIRAQPVKSLFQRMSRIVRESSATVDKDVRLVTEGETTEVDKTVIERLADPLTHMIRNAVDHGLESTEKRLAAGKPAQGRVRLSASHRSGRVIIDVADDGGGIDRARVLDIAITKGLVPADVSLSDGEIDNLLFLPGFSTAEAISDISGRGVGMDVVRNAIQSLGGRITITSEPGVGTTFSISLPLTLAVLEGMVVKVAEETLVLPLSSVVETLALQDTQVEVMPSGQTVIRVRGEFVAIFDLAAELGYRERRAFSRNAIVLLLAQDSGTRAALLIDGIQDQRQVVIKGLSDSIQRAPGIAAATILGDGQIALILDPSDIISHAASRQVLRRQVLEEIRT